jgi:hypothetical protein
MLNNFEIKLLRDITLSKWLFAVGLQIFAKYANEEEIFNN